MAGVVGFVFNYTYAFSQKSHKLEYLITTGFNPLTVKR